MKDSVDKLPTYFQNKIYMEKGQFELEELVIDGDNMKLNLNSHSLIINDDLNKRAKADQKALAFYNSFVSIESFSNKQKFNGSYSDLELTFTDKNT